MKNWICKQFIVTVQGKVGDLWVHFMLLVYYTINWDCCTWIGTRKNEILKLRVAIKSTNFQNIFLPVVTFSSVNIRCSRHWGCCWRHDGFECPSACWTYPSAWPATTSAPPHPPSRPWPSPKKKYNIDSVHCIVDLLLLIYNSTIRFYSIWRSKVNYLKWKAMWIKLDSN